MNFDVTDFGGLDSSGNIPEQIRSTVTIAPLLREKLRKLKTRKDIRFRFVDLDGTLLNDEVRFNIDPPLREHRGDAAIPYIQQKYGDEADPLGFKNFVKLLEPMKNKYKNTDKFYDPKNPYDFILTAGNIYFQKEKIDQLELPEDAKKLLVFHAKNKPLVILLTCLRMGFIPGKIEFYDDRISNFDGVDSILSEVLGIPVAFFEAVADNQNNTVLIRKYSSAVNGILEE